MADGIGLGAADLAAARPAWFADEVAAAGFTSTTGRVAVARAAVDDLLADIYDRAALAGAGLGERFGPARFLMAVLLLLAAMMRPATFAPAMVAVPLPLAAATALLAARFLGADRVSLADDHGGHCANERHGRQQAEEPAPRRGGRETPDESVEARCVHGLSFARAGGVISSDVLRWVVIRTGSGTACRARLSASAMLRASHLA
jgi:hypothetical protein